MTTRPGLGLVLLLLAGACEPAPNDPEPPATDPDEFREVVYPILLADCAFVACHGTSDRFFAIYGPGRARLDPASLPYDPPTPEELAFSHARARSMLVSPQGPRQAPLLRKPLAVSAGGAGHGGDDVWGAAIYASKTDPRYEALFFWATAGEEDP
jgi:hypothetical protein